jgi:hypothetical protein
MSDKLIKESPSVINIHGFPTTEQFYDYAEWEKYALNRLSMVKDRITIKDFLDRDQFIKSKSDSKPEPKRVKDMIDDPLPPDTRGGARVGQRNSGWKSSSHPDYQSMQRREWGFREKVLQGYPDYDPDKIGYGDLNNKVIAGFVTVGDGVFSGIPSYANIKLNKEETRRQIEYGYGRVTGREMIPTGLCFIQDETSGIGISLGSDVRYIWHPRLYGTNLSNANLMVDDMHMGSTTIPKADYRQFLRVGDFVIIEIGTRLKYWHSLLGGSRPDYWESLVGYRELYDVMPRDQFYNMRLDVRENLESRFLGGQNRYNPPLDNRGRDLYKKTLNGVPKIFGNTQRFRDTPIKNMTHTVIDHPWSTGTPIPVNSGMPYVMMEDYAVDSTHRFGPAPLVIQARDMRDLDGSGINPASKLKGRLVRLNNLRFVKSPKTRALVAELATDNRNNTLLPGIYTSSMFKYAPAIDNSIEIAEDLQRMGLNALLEVPSSYWADRVLRPIGINDTEPFTNYNGNIEIWKHILTSRYGVDYSGYKFELPTTSERNDLLPERDQFGNDRWSRDKIRTYNPPQRRKPGSWPDIIISEQDKETWNSQTNRNGLLYYRYADGINQSFPKTVDRNPDEPQPYWFTNPNIPLTNAMEIGPPEAESTWLRTSTKVEAYIQRGGREFRRVGDLSRGGDVAEQSYYYHYENNPRIKQEWDGNNLQPEDDGYFIPNKTYYLTDQNGVVIPIRINANTEIARFKVPIPKGLVDVIGIMWQYSLGTPGLEWERESYMMQVWPRFLSDIIPLEQKIVVQDRVTEIDEGTDVPDVITPEVPEERTPTRLPDQNIDFGDSVPLGSISIVNCDRLNEYFNSVNTAIRLTNSNEPLVGCDSLQPGQEVYYIVSSSIWYGLTRTFYFRKDANGNCTCVLVPRGTNLQQSNLNTL